MHPFLPSFITFVCYWILFIILFFISFYKTLRSLYSLTNHFTLANYCWTSLFAGLSVTMAGAVLVMYRKTFVFILPQTFVDIYIFAVKCTSYYILTEAFSSEIFASGLSAVIIWPVILLYYIINIVYLIKDMFPVIIGLVILSYCIINILYLIKDISLEIGTKLLM